MTHAIKANNSKIWHLTDEKPNTDSVTAKCGRKLSYPDYDRDGYNFEEMHTWPAFKSPDEVWKLCPHCGAMADFMAVSRERWQEAEQYRASQEAARSEARAKATAKATILKDVWQQTLDSLQAIGWQVQPPQYRRYKATMQVDGFTFEMELVRPDTAFGVATNNGQVTEMVR